VFVEWPSQEQSLSRFALFLVYVAIAIRSPPDLKVTAFLFLFFMHGKVLVEMCVSRREALLVWSGRFDLLFNLAASSVLPFFSVADFGCRNIARLDFACTDLCFCSDFSFLTQF
jgi:hypothetical protein